MVRVSVPALLVVLMVTIGAADVAAQDKPAPPSKSAAPAAVVNLNTATAAQIATLPGIGEKAAQRIIEYREKNGGFKKPEEILETSRSSLILLTIVRFDPLATVSGSRKKSQEISL